MLSASLDASYLTTKVHARETCNRDGCCRDLRSQPIPAILPMRRIRPKEASHLNVKVSTAVLR